MAVFVLPWLAEVSSCNRNSTAPKTKKYLFSGPLQKKIPANPWTSTVSRYPTVWMKKLRHRNVELLAQKCWVTQLGSCRAGILTQAL